LIILVDTKTFKCCMQGRWQDVAAVAKKLMDTASAYEESDLNQEGDKVEKLGLHAFHILALFKLRVIQEAEIQLSNIENERASWPFMLRFLETQILFEKVSPDTDSLKAYMLLEQMLSESIEKSTLHGHEGEMWKNRAIHCGMSMVGHYICRSQIKAALGLLDRLLKEMAEYEVLWLSQASRIFAICGDLEKAEELLERSLALGQEKQDVFVFGQSLSVLSQLDQANVLSMRGKLDQAEALYQSISDQYTGSVMISSNLAVLNVLKGDPLRARMILEDEFKQRFSSAISEPVVTNLLNAMTLAPPASENIDMGFPAAQKVGAWVATAAPDDYMI